MTRILTAAVLIPIILSVVLWAPSWLFVCVVALVALLCFHEYAGIAAGYGLGFDSYWGFAPGVLVLLIDSRVTMAMTVVALIAMLAAMRSDDLGKVLPWAGAFLLGIIYVFGSWRAAIALREINAYWLLFALTINWVGDTAAFYVGRAFGRRKLAPRISPAKTWEGAGASLIASVVYVLVLFGVLLPEFPKLQVAGLAVAGNLAGQFGDLAESALKRGAGVKDSGSLLPGHGGWLDRVDSSMFAIPVIYLLLTGF